MTYEEFEKEVKDELSYIWNVKMDVKSTQIKALLTVTHRHLERLDERLTILEREKYK